MATLYDRARAKAQGMQQAQAGGQAYHYACTIHFDGGAVPNPGAGYGSWLITDDTNGAILRRTIKRPFGDNITNNQAEYMACIGGLADLTGILARSGVALRDTAITIIGDSQLVINQLTGTFKVGTPSLLPLLDQARALMGQYGAITATWIPREQLNAILEPPAIPDAPELRARIGRGKALIRDLNEAMDSATPEQQPELDARAGRAVERLTDLMDTYTEYYGQLADDEQAEAVPA